jgi:hypothetical protein
MTKDTKSFNLTLSLKDPNQFIKCTKITGRFTGEEATAVCMDVEYKLLYGTACDV